ncbi:hypothetical protein [Capnocytophaga canimorsus]|uniref:hypothetical protein n=1 Tax=Capnocytophaga canimorsus TaxID=28188 RepID=UPI0037CEAE4F
MTTAEMLASVEAQIRKDIPRLMELREGCVIEYFRNGRAYNCKVVETFPSYFNMYFDSEIESIDFELSENTFQIIGHDIMLNDVLEWLNSKNKNIAISSDGTLFELNKAIFYNKIGIGDCGIIKWDLSKLLLKDQSEELVKFLYKLIKE